MTKSKTTKPTTETKKETEEPKEKKKLTAMEILKMPVMAKFRTRKSDFVDDIISKKKPSRKK